MNDTGLREDRKHSDGPTTFVATDDDERRIRALMDKVQLFALPEGTDPRTVILWVDEKRPIGVVDLSRFLADCPMLPHVRAAAVRFVAAGKLPVILSLGDGRIVMVGGDTVLHTGPLGRA